MTAVAIPLYPFRGEITEQQRARLETIRILMLAAARTRIGQGWELDMGIRLPANYTVVKLANGPVQAVDTWIGVVEAELASDSCAHTFTGLDLAAIKTAITALRERAKPQI